jgi:hypothetical protein
MTEKPTYNYLIVYAIVYFFFNSFLLPHGLLYTSILTPLMLYFLYKEKKIKNLVLGGGLILLPVPFHFINGVETSSYLLSVAMIITILILFFTIYYLLKNKEDAAIKIFKKILIVNGAFVLIALIILPIEPIRGLLWYEEMITQGLQLIPRLKLFTYEASYYSFIMMPVFLFFTLKILNGVGKHPMIIGISILASLLLSLSFGVIASFLLALLIAVLIYWNDSNAFFKRFVLLSFISFASLMVLLAIVWPANPIYFRLNNIITGADTSAMGRLVYSFMFAKDLVVTYNPVFGVGPGQIKILAHDMIVNHYQYQGDIAEIVRIPNSMAELLALYGIYGFAIKLFAEIYFFFRFKLYQNTYSFILFLFLFIYQFTGSFITNAAEVASWAMVFGLRFKEFEIIRNKRIAQ